MIGKTPEERGKLHLEFQTLTPCRAVNLLKLIGAEKFMRLTARSFGYAQDDDWVGYPHPIGNIEI